MGIPSSSTDVGMSKKLLHGAEVGTGSKGECSKGMAAAMRREPTHIRLSLPQLVEEAVIVPGEIPRIHQSTGLGTEDIDAGFGQSMEPIGEFRKQRYDAETCRSLCYMLLNTRLILVHIHSAIHSERIIGQVGPFQTQQFATPQAGQQQGQDSCGNSYIGAIQGEADDTLDFFQGKSLSGTFSNARNPQMLRRIFPTQIIIQSVTE